MGLQDAREEFAVNYSLGMRKRLALACALVHDPPLLILDEPTNSLDPHAARAVQTLMRARAEAGKTVFLSTHLLEMAEACCHRVAIINQGNLVVTGEVSDLRRQAGGTLTDVFFQATSSRGVDLMNSFAARVGATLHTTRLLTQLQLRLVFNRILVGGRAGGSGRQASYGKAKAVPGALLALCCSP